MTVEMTDYREALPPGIVLKEGQSAHELFVRVQASKLPKNLRQAGTWATRAFRDKGLRVEMWVSADTTADYQYINAVAVCSNWVGERVKFHRKAAVGAVEAASVAYSAE